MKMGTNILSHKSGSSVYTDELLLINQRNFLPSNYFKNNARYKLYFIFLLYIILKKLDMGN